MFKFYDNNLKEINYNYFCKNKNTPRILKTEFYINKNDSYLKLSTLVNLGFNLLQIKLNNIELKYFDVKILNPSSYLLLLINYDENLLIDGSYCLNSYGNICKVKIYNNKKYYKIIGCNYYYTVDDDIKFITVLNYQKNSFKSINNDNYVNIELSNYNKIIKHGIDGYFMMYKIPLLYKNPPETYYCPLISHHNY